MKIKMLATASAVLLLSGCSQEAATPPQSSSEKIDCLVAGNCVTGATDTTQKARQAVDTATQQENKGLAQQEIQQTDNSSKTPITMHYADQYDGAILHTSQGDITVKFYNDTTPLTIENFLKLAQEKFYDGVRFHRVIKGFMIQTGDPNSKDADWSNDGTGGPGYTIPAEIKHKNTRGTLATARLGDEMNPKKESSGSQFYINTVDNGFLDGQYTVFGEVVSGMDIVDAIESVKVNANDHPLEDITIKSVDLVSKK